MSKRIIVATVLVLLIACGVGALFRKARLSPASTTGESDRQGSENPQAANRITTKGKWPAIGSLGHSRTGHTAISEGVPVSEEVLRYAANIKADPQYDWKQLINFYGRAVDERNQPVAGATANFEWTGLSESGTSKATTTSDENGVFSLTERHGKRLIVDVAKRGYYSSNASRNASFEYANPGDGLFTPDAARPVIFQLRRKGEAAHLLHCTKLFGSRVDGTLSYVDLATAKSKLTPPGDLTVRCTRSLPNTEKRFDWTFTLSVPEGGLVESMDEFMFLAPDDGYQPSFQISHRALAKDWAGQERHKFFIKSQNGQRYARIVITIIPDYSENAAYDLEWFLNPDASPNLESDPSKTTDVQ